MDLKKYKIGEFIEPYSQRCGIADLIPEQVSGINIDKEFLSQLNRWVMTQVITQVITQVKVLILCINNESMTKGEMLKLHKFKHK